MAVISQQQGCSRSFERSAPYADVTVTMRANFTTCFVPLTVLLLVQATGQLPAQESITLTEEFQPGHASRVEVSVKLAGKLVVPLEKGQAPQLVPLSGSSRVLYEERVLPPDEPGTLKAIRAYREVAFVRTLGDFTQDAGIRPSVRRMVVIQADNRRAPFSPDGPLTWGEIDVVRTDVFNPTLVPGLLPAAPVRIGQTWTATGAAVTELTDLRKVESGELTVELLGVTTVQQRRVARLKITGTIRGINDDGPNCQKLEGTAYFDLDGKFLSYLSLKGTHELLDAAGQVAGQIDGQFTMTRALLTQLPPDLSDASLKGLDLKPTAENTLLLYDNTQLGVRFLYPRGWRVGAVQGKQVTLDHARGAGALITVEAANRVPTVEDYRQEALAFLAKQKAEVKASSKPQRIRAEPVQLDRFGLDVAFGAEPVRLEYAVLKQRDGGVTLAVRIPASEAAALEPEIDRLIRSLSVTKKIE
jgi:hypothetical protein